MVLRLPGKIIDVSYIVNKKKKFRGNKGGIEGALASMKTLQEDGLGKLLVKSKKGSVEVSSVYLIRSECMYTVVRGYSFKCNEHVILYQQPLAKGVVKWQEHL